MSNAFLALGFPSLIPFLNWAIKATFAVGNHGVSTILFVGHELVPRGYFERNRYFSPIDPFLPEPFAIKAKESHINEIFP